MRYRRLGTRYALILSGGQPAPLEDPWPAGRLQVPTSHAGVAVTGHTAWLVGGEVPAIPLVGPRTVAELDECLAAVDLELDPGQRRRLDGPRTFVG